MSQKFKNLFLTISGISVFGSALTNICLLSIAAQKNSISGVTWIIISGYIGMSASGLLNGLLSRHFGHTNLLKTCEALRFVVLGLLFVFPLDSIINYILITFVLNILEGIYHPNRYSFINKSFQDVREKNLFFTKLQSIDNTLSIVGPVVAGLLIAIISVQVLFLVDAITYLVSFLYWLKAPREGTKVISKESVFLGYKEILKNTPLLLMNISRLLGNYIFIAWKILLPALILLLFSKEDFGLLQGILLGVMALGLLATNYIIGKLNFSETHFIHAAWIGGLVGFSLVIYALTNGVNLYALIFISFFLGISNAGFRTGGIILGTKITPKESLHLVIAAGDSIIRPVSGVMAILIGMTVQGKSSNDVTMLYLAALALPILAITTILYLASIKKSLKNL